MLTRGAEFAQFVEETLSALRRLSHGPHARHDVAALIDPLGSRLETFLRTTALPASSRGDTLKQLIAALAPAGLSSSHLDALDDVRSLYNRSKHKPSEGLPLGEAINVVRCSLDAITDFVALGLGIAAVPYQRELNYHLHVGFWDHYCGGETEVAVILPGDHWTHAATVDTFNMDIRSWDALKPLLSSHQQFRLGKENFQPEVWKSFENEGDFLNAGVWDGDYGELIRLLAPFDDRNIAARLMPGLARADNWTSVATALVAAAVDVARAATAPLTLEELRRALKSRADREYAVPVRGPSGQAAVTQVATLICAVPFERWCHLVGPVLVKEADASANSTLGPLRIKTDGNAILLGFV